MPTCGVLERHPGCQLVGCLNKLYQTVLVASAVWGCFDDSIELVGSFSVEVMVIRNMVDVKSLVSQLERSSNTPPIALTRSFPKKNNLPSLP